jgi:hypothetical protein
MKTEIRFRFKKETDDYYAMTPERTRGYTLIHCSRPMLSIKDVLVEFYQDIKKAVIIVDIFHS